METLETKKNPKKPQNFLCKNCDFHTVNKKDYMRHLLTRKHLSSVDGNILETDFSQKNPKKPNRNIAVESEHKCSICCREYTTRAGYWKHSKKYHADLENLLSKTDASNNTVISQDVVVELIKQNKELQTMLVDQHNKYMEDMKQGSTIINTNNNSNNNNTNNHFNLQFFLNNQCKDALNMVDFIDSLKVQIEDLERTGQLGYVDGISRIFINGLKDMDICMRPVHCSDLKRETVYVKHENRWDKDDAEKTKLKQAVQKVAQKNLAQLRNWLEKNPTCKDTSTPESEIFVQLSHNAIGGCSRNETDRLDDKIMKNILKEVVVDKNR